MTQRTLNPASRHHEQLHRIALLAAAHQWLNSDRSKAPAYPEIEPVDTGNGHRDLLIRSTAIETAENEPLRLSDTAAALQLLREEAGHADARHPEWDTMNPEKGQWHLRPSEMRIVLASQPGTLNQIVYPTRRAADGSERNIRIEYQADRDGKAEANDTRGEPAWTGHLTLGVRLLRLSAPDARAIWENLARAPENDHTTPPQLPEPGGYGRLAGTYAACQWMSGAWSTPPPDEVLKEIETTLGTNPKRAWGGVGDRKWRYESESDAVAAMRTEAASSLAIRRIGWTRPEPSAGAPVRADQARVVIGGGELICRIAMNGQLTDPQPPGIEEDDWRGRWTPDTTNAVEHLHMLAAHWLAGLLHLTRPA